MTCYIASLFPYQGEKAERTISGKASSFQKCKGRCFVSGSSCYPSNCLAFWRPQTNGRQRSPIVWYCETNTWLTTWFSFPSCHTIVHVHVQISLGSLTNSHLSQIISLKLKIRTSSPHLRTDLLRTVMLGIQTKELLKLQTEEQNIQPIVQHMNLSLLFTCCELKIDSTQVGFFSLCSTVLQHKLC